MRPALLLLSLAGFGACTFGQDDSFAARPWDGMPSYEAPPARSVAGDDAGASSGGPSFEGVRGYCDSGNAVYFDGDLKRRYPPASGEYTDYIHPGMAKITSGTFRSTSGSTYAVASVDVTPTDAAQGRWSLDFSVQDLGSKRGEKDIVPGMYEMAMRYPFENPGYAGLSVTGDGRGCNKVTGRFTIHAIEWDRTTTKSDQRLVRLDASFEQHCEG